MFKNDKIKGFGNYLKLTRESMGFSRKNVEDIAGISCDSLRRIETGEVTPRYETLVILSNAYKKDLLEDLFIYSNSETLFEYYSRLESIIVYNDTEALKNLSSDFSQYLKEANFDAGDLVDKKIIEQFDTLLRGISKYYSQSPEDSYEFFVSAMKYTNSMFDVVNFSELKYTIFELRILLLIALSVVHKNQISQSNSILTFLLEKSNFDKRSSANEKLLIIKIYLNLSYNYHRLDLHDKALDYATAGIEFCNNNHLSYGLAQLYSRKGIAEFLSNKPDYIRSLEQSICLMTMTNQKELAIKYLNIMQKSYNITLPSFSVSVKEWTHGK